MYANPKLKQWSESVSCVSQLVKLASTYPMMKLIQNKNGWGLFWWVILVSSSEDTNVDLMAYSHWNTKDLNIDLCGNTSNILGQQLTASSTCEFANVLQKKALIMKRWMKCKDEAKQSKFLVIRLLRRTEVRLHMMLLCPFRHKQQMKTRVFSPLWSKRQNALSLLHFNPKQEKGERKRYQSQRPNPRAEASPLETS